MNWLKAHWRTIASAACTVAASAATPYPVIAAAVGTVCTAIAQNKDAKAVLRASLDAIVDAMGAKK